MLLTTQEVWNVCGYIKIWGKKNKIPFEVCLIGTDISDLQFCLTLYGNSQDGTVIPQDLQITHVCTAVSVYPGASKSPEGSEDTLPEANKED